MSEKIHLSVVVVFAALAEIGIYEKGSFLSSLLLNIHTHTHSLVKLLGHEIYSFLKRHRLVIKIKSSCWCCCLEKQLE